MYCKECGGMLEEDQHICPACGADNASGEPQTDETQTVTEGVDQNADNAPAQAEGFEVDAAFDENDDESALAEETGEGDGIEFHVATEEDLLGPETPHSTSKKPGKGLLIGLCVVALAAVVALVLAFTGILGGDKAPAGDPTDVAVLDESGVFVPHDYTKANDQITEAEANAVIATAGKAELTNTQLSYYYWQQYYNLYSTYGAYISYIIDTTKPLAEQMYDDTHSWQDMLLQSSLTAFRQNSALCAAAEKAGFTLDEEYETYLSTMRENMDADAQANGYVDGADYLKSFYGPYCDIDSYLAYARSTFLASSYLQTQFDTITYEPADVAAYFDTHPEDFAEQNLSKDDPKMVDVRHILITPTADEGAEPGEDGQPVLTDENWAVAKAKADEVYALWQAGDATEDSFAALVTEHSTDPGSMETGGLYEDVYPGQMMPEFNDWCFDTARAAGDSGIVKTDYGYHIMYFSAVGENAYWYTQAETALQQSLQQTLVEDLIAKLKFKTDLTKVVIGESDLVEMG